MDGKMMVTHFGGGRIRNRESAESGGTRSTREHKEWGGICTCAVNKWVITYSTNMESAADSVGIGSLYNVTRNSDPSEANSRRIVKAKANCIIQCPSGNDIWAKFHSNWSKFHSNCFLINNKVEKNHIDQFKYGSNSSERELKNEPNSNESEFKYLVSLVLSC